MNNTTELLFIEFMLFTIDKLNLIYYILIFLSSVLLLFVVFQFANFIIKGAWR